MGPSIKKKKSIHLQKLIGGGYVRAQQNIHPRLQTPIDPDHPQNDDTDPFQDSVAQWTV